MSLSSVYESKAIKFFYHQPHHVINSSLSMSLQSFAMINALVIHFTCRLKSTIVRLALSYAGIKRLNLKAINRTKVVCARARERDTEYKREDGPAKTFADI